ncbi:MAG: IS110 family transposase, partial [Chloroflexi bacterium]|nr:IS110 family transposase [Chloroflexota bacterium]
HSLLVTIYHMLRRGTTYQDLGGQYFDHRTREAVVRNALRRFQRLGYSVTLAPPTPAPAFS